MDKKRSDVKTGYFSKAELQAIREGVEVFFFLSCGPRCHHCDWHIDLPAEAAQDPKRHGVRCEGSLVAPVLFGRSPIVNALLEFE